MPEAIKAIQLTRFKKFKKNDLTVSSHNVLVGANNSGKTTVLHALRLFFFAASNEFLGEAGRVRFHKRYVQLDQILPVSDSEELWTNCTKGNTKATGVLVSVKFLSGLEIEISFTHRFGQVHVDGEIISNPKKLNGVGINKALSHRVAFIPGLVGILPQEPYVTPARRSAMSIEARYSEMYRSSLLHLSASDKKALTRINKVLAQHLGVEITDINFDPENDVFVDVKYKQDGVSLDLSNAGSGMLQVIQLLVYIYLYKPTLLLIDEPDAHLHPELQAKLGNILKDVSSEMGAQLIVATHSPDVIDSFEAENVYFISSAKTHLRPFKEDNAFVQGLLDSGIVTNSSLSRIAVRPRCLVVEDSKVQIFRRIDEICGTGLLEVQGEFRRAKGVSKFRTINEVYLTVQDVVGKKISLFFVQDSDGLPDRYINYIQQKYKNDALHVHILRRHEVENYLIDAKVIRAAMQAKGCDLSLSEAREALKAAALSIKYETRGDIRRKAIDVNRFCGRPEGLEDMAVEADVDKWFDELRLTEEVILRIFPGKELLRSLRDHLEQEHSIDLRIGDLMRALTKRRVAPDVKDALQAISESRHP